MPKKDKNLMAGIEKYILDYTKSNGFSPSMKEIADGVGSSAPTVYRYLRQMREDGVVAYDGVRSVKSARLKGAEIDVPVLGRIACGIPKFAEENIEEYVRLPAAFFGTGEFFLLRAWGDSMTGAAIDDGDLVLIRRQDHAERGQIVVALAEYEATLKRYYPEPERQRVRLHPENPQMEDIYVDSCVIQGVAVKVLKDLD